MIDYNKLSNHELNLKAFILGCKLGYWVHEDVDIEKNTYSDKIFYDACDRYVKIWDGCNNWRDVGVIMEQECIGVSPLAGGDFRLWCANDMYYSNVDDSAYDENPRRAVLIKFLQMYEGAE